MLMALAPSAPHIATLKFTSTANMLMIAHLQLQRNVNCCKCGACQEKRKNIATSTTQVVELTVFYHVLPQRWQANRTNYLFVLQAGTHSSPFSCSSTSMPYSLSTSSDVIATSSSSDSSIRASSTIFSPFIYAVQGSPVSTFSFQ